MVVWAEVRTSVAAAVVVAVAVVVVVGAGWWWCWTRSMSRRGDTLRSDDNQGNSLWGDQIPEPRFYHTQQVEQEEVLAVAICGTTMLPYPSPRGGQPLGPSPSSLDPKP